MHYTDQALESGIGWPEPAYTIGRSDLEKREKKIIPIISKAYDKFIQFFDAFIAGILCLNFADDGIVEALDFFLIRWWCILDPFKFKEIF